MEGEIEDVDQLIINLIDLISFGDHKELQNLLNKVEIDLAEVYDERGYNLIHICAQNNDYICLNIIINYAFLYWNNNKDINQQYALNFLYEWVNQPSKPPTLVIVNNQNFQRS